MVVLLLLTAPAGEALMLMRAANWLSEGRRPFGFVGFPASGDVVELIVVDDRELDDFALPITTAKHCHPNHFYLITTDSYLKHTVLQVPILLLDWKDRNHSKFIAYLYPVGTA